MVQEAVEEVGVMEGPSDTELLFAVGKWESPEAAEHLQVVETLTSVMQKYAVIWQKTSEQMRRAICERIGLFKNITLLRRKDLRQFLSFLIVSFYWSL